MKDDALDSACELAFQVAREGLEANPPINPPAAMRSFLYVAHLPRRAMTVAQRAIEEDPEFRARVVAVAEEDSVGVEGQSLHQGIDNTQIGLVRNDKVDVFSVKTRVLQHLFASLAHTAHRRSKNQTPVHF